MVTDFQIDFLNDSTLFLTFGELILIELAKGFNLRHHDGQSGSNIPGSSVWAAAFRPRLWSATEGRWLLLAAFSYCNSQLSINASSNAKVDSHGLAIGGLSRLWKWIKNGKHNLNYLYKVYAGDETNMIIVNSSSLVNQLAKPTIFSFSEYNVRMWIRIIFIKIFAFFGLTSTLNGQVNQIETSLEVQI